MLKTKLHHLEEKTYDLKKFRYIELVINGDIYFKIWKGYT